MARYKCDFCDLEVDPRSSSAYHLITGWAKGVTQNVKYVEADHHKYAHGVCMPRNIADDQPTLFK